MSASDSTVRSAAQPPDLDHQNGNVSRIAIIGNEGFAMLNFRGALIARLVAQGHQVFAFAPRLTVDETDALRQLGAVPISYALSPRGIAPWANAASFWQLLRLLRQIRPQRVLAATIKPVVLGVIAARLAGVSHRYALIEGLGRAFIRGGPSSNPLLRVIVRALYRIALPQATRTLFLNDDDRAEFVARRFVAPSKAETIGGIGVDLTIWAAASPVLSPVTFIFVGRLLKEKGILDFVAAARRLKSQVPGVSFIVLGDVERGGGRAIRIEVETARRDGIVEWPGHVQVLPWLQRASVFVLPSYYREGVPRSAQEALALGRPVITTDLPGCRETVVDGENGVLVPPRDPDALVRAMGQFVDNPELIARMGQRSRALAVDRFNVDRANDRLLKAMQL